MRGVPVSRLPDYDMRASCANSLEGRERPWSSFATASSLYFKQHGYESYR